MWENTYLILYSRHIAVGSHTLADCIISIFTITCSKKRLEGDTQANCGELPGKHQGQHGLSLSNVFVQVTNLSQHDPARRQLPRHPRRPEPSTWEVSVPLDQVVVASHLNAMASKHMKVSACHRERSGACATDLDNTSNQIHLRDPFAARRVHSRHRNYCSIIKTRTQRCILRVYRALQPY